MRIVVALGGNALLRRGEKPDAEIQEHHGAQAVEALDVLYHAHGGGIPVVRDDVVRCAGWRPWSTRTGPPISWRARSALMPSYS